MSNIDFLNSFTASAGPASLGVIPENVLALGQLGNALQSEISAQTEFESMQYQAGKLNGVFNLSQTDIHSDMNVDFGLKQ